MSSEVKPGVDAADEEVGCKIVESDEETTTRVTKNSEETRDKLSVLLETFDTVGLFFFAQMLNLDITHLFKHKLH